MYDCVSDCFRKKPKRAMEMFITIPILLAFYGMHLYLPSYADARALTLLNFNCTMMVITFDLMLLNMSAKPFMAIHPAFILLLVPLVATFVFKCEAQTEIYISMACALLGFVVYMQRMICLTVQYLDYTKRSFLFRHVQDKDKSA